MLIITEEIREMMDRVNEWEIGAGIFKEGTPREILDLHDRILNEWASEMDGVM